MKERLLSINETAFIQRALREGKRLDGRGLYDFRKVRIAFGSEYGHVQVQVGRTRVIGVVTGEITVPFHDRPTEGFLSINTEFSPMASEAFEGGRPTDELIELARVVDRGLKESRAIDTEGLCVVAGDKVWSIRCDIHILDHDGNLVDAANLAAVLALKHFRRKDISVIGETVTVHDFDEKEPVPLTIHHTPICVTLSFFDDGNTVLVDSNWKEENTRQGSMTITMNAHNEICCVHKGGGVPIDLDQLLLCTRIAQVKVQELGKLIESALEQTKKGNTDNLGQLSSGQLKLGTQVDADATAGSSSGSSSSSSSSSGSSFPAPGLDTTRTSSVKQVSSIALAMQAQGEAEDAELGVTESRNVISGVDSAALQEFEIFAENFLKVQHGADEADEEDEEAGDEDEMDVQDMDSEGEVDEVEDGDSKRGTGRGKPRAGAKTHAEAVQRGRSGNLEDAINSEVAESKRRKGKGKGKSKGKG